MDFGMPTLVELQNIDRCVALCKDLQLEFIELNMNFPMYQVDMIDIDKYKKIMEKEDIYYTIHLDEKLNVSDFNKEVSRAYLNTVLATIEIAKQLEAPVLNMHMAEGVFITLPNKRLYLYHQYKGIYLAKLKEFRNLCEKAIDGKNIKICIENTDGYKDFMVEGIEMLLESDVFSLTFDIGHNHGKDGVDEAFLLKHRDRLQHMHIHDAIGKSNHLVIGDGEIDIKEKLKLAKECNCRCVLETKTIAALKETTSRLIRYLP
ncbi:MAG: xylose isomerase [Herbinix sp.]|jgi:sugar phosphate isomerase/epimerase|nr:xylose isomerase [Herbinix sp.]